MSAQLISAAFTAVVTLYLVRVLGPQGFGELALVLSVGHLGLIVADAAVAQSTARFAATAHADPQQVAAVVSAGLRLKLVLTLAVALALVALADPIARAYGEPAMTWALRLVALSVVVESVMKLWLVAFQALRRISINVRLYLVESLAEAAAILSLVTLGFGVAGAVLGRALGYAVGALAGAVLLTRLLGRHLDLRHPDRVLRRRIGGYAAPLFVTTGTDTVYGQVDVQLIGALLTRSLVGIYAAPLRLITLLSYPGQAVASTVAPRMAGPEPDVAAFTASLRWLLIYQWALVAPVVVWAEPITVLVLGSQYRESADVLTALAPYLFMLGLGMLVTNTVNYLGQARRRIPIVVASLVLNVVLDVLLLPVIGVVGAAIGTGVSYAVYLPLHLRICRESFPVPLRPLARTAARAGLAAGACVGVLLAVGTGELSVAQWLVGAVGGGLAFVGVLVVTRELTGADGRHVRGVVGAVRARVLQP